jgi:hypothetical protein
MEIIEEPQYKSYLWIHCFKCSTEITKSFGCYIMLYFELWCTETILNIPIYALVNVSQRPIMGFCSSSVQCWPVSFATILMFVHVHNPPSEFSKWMMQAQWLYHSELKIVNVSWEKTVQPECEAHHAPLPSPHHHLQINDLWKPPVDVQTDGNLKLQVLDCMLDGQTSNFSSQRVTLVAVVCCWALSVYQHIISYGWVLPTVIRLSCTFCRQEQKCRYFLNHPFTFWIDHLFYCIHTKQGDHSFYVSDAWFMLFDTVFNSCLQTKFVARYGLFPAFTQLKN